MFKILTLRPVSAPPNARSVRDPDGGGADRQKAGTSGRARLVQRRVGEDSDNPSRRPPRSAIALGTGLVKDALGPAVVVVDGDERAAVPDAGVIVFGLVLLEA